MNTTAQTIEDTSTIDLWTTTSVKVQASKLRECMVLMDLDLGTPAAWLDHKMPTTRNSGNVSWLAHDLVTGRLITVTVRANLNLSVLAA